MQNHTYIANNNGITLVYEHGEVFVIRYFASLNQWLAMYTGVNSRIGKIDWANEKDSWWFNENRVTRTNG